MLIHLWGSWKKRHRRIATRWLIKCCGAENPTWFETTTSTHVKQTPEQLTLNINDKDSLTAHLFHHVRFCQADSSPVTKRVCEKTQSVWAGEDIFNSLPVLQLQKCSLHVVKQRQSDQLLSVCLLKGMYSMGIWNFFVHSWLGREWVVTSAKYFSWSQFTGLAV